MRIDKGGWWRKNDQVFVIIVLVLVLAIVLWFLLTIEVWPHG